MSANNTATSGVGQLPSETESRSRLAWLANKRQELLAPVGALLELSEMLSRDAAERDHHEFLRDQQQVHAAASYLLKVLHDVLDPLNTTVAEEEQTRRIGHDMRSRLTEITGLCEIWLEDAAEQLLEGFVEDLQAILALSRKLLDGLDGIFAFGKVLSDADIDLDSLAPEQAESLRDLVASLPRPDADQRSRPRETGSILVVDDNAINRDVLTRRLGRDGHRVALAEDGLQALAMAQAEEFDLILLDIILPGLNGFQVLEQLKADPALRHVPVIMISAFHELDGVVHCLEMGAEDYLPKPFNPVLLRARIDGCLEKKRLRDREVSHLAEIDRERKRADELLHVILPAEVVRELKATNTVKPRRHDDVAVLFCDIVGFTPFCDRNQPEQVVAPLQELIEAWEEIALRHGVQKIKTIGDAFMAAAGLLRPADNPVLNCLHCGLEMIAACQARPTGWNLRVGIHVGPVVAGVIGRRQYLFDLWGDTVNTAARMESHGVPGAVTLSAAAWERVASCCRGESRGMVSVKGKGAMEMIRFDGFLDR